MSTQLVGSLFLYHKQMCERGILLDIRNLGFNDLSHIILNLLKHLFDDLAVNLPYWVFRRS
jgi:hypothetical protein